MTYAVFSFNLTSTRKSPQISVKLIACLMTHLTATRKSRLGRVHLNGVLVVPCLAVGLHTTHHTLKHSAVHIRPDSSPNIQTHTFYVCILQLQSLFATQSRNTVDLLSTLCISPEKQS